MRADIAVGKYTIGKTVALDSEGIVRADAIAPLSAQLYHTKLREF